MNSKQYPETIRLFGNELKAIGHGKFPYDCISKDEHPDAMIYYSEKGGWAHEFDPLVRAQIDAAQSIQEIADKQVFAGYPITELEKAFNLVADPKDWKAPIAAVCYGEGVNIIVAAIQFYTATNPKVSCNPASSTGPIQFLIESEGYRNGPAGDH